MKEYTNSQMEALIDDLIHSKRDRLILKDRYIDGMTFEALSEKHDLSTQRIKAIVYKAQKRIFERL